MGVSIRISGDDPLVRAGLGQGLRAAGAEVMSDSAGSGAEPGAGRAAPIRLHDCGPADIAPSLPGGEGPLIALVAGARAARAALQAGAQAVLARDGQIDRLHAAIQAVLAGMRVIDAPLSVDLFGRAERRPRAQRPLSAREREVIDLLAAGQSNKEIATHLDISEHTAKFHVNAILDKLGAQSRTDAVVRAVRTGQVSL